MHLRLLQLARNSRLGLAVTIFAGLFAGLLTIAQAFLITRTINSVFLEGHALGRVIGLMWGILVIIALRGLLTWLNEMAASHVAIKIKSEIRQRLFEHMLVLGPSYVRTQQTGDLITAAVESIEALDAYFSQYLPQLVISTLIPVSILVFVFPMDPLSGLLLLLSAPLIPFFMYMIGKGAEAATGRQYETLRRLSAHFLDSLQGLTTLKIFGQSKAQSQNIAIVSNRFRDTTLKVLQVTFLSALALELLATLSTAVIAVEVGLRLLYARMEFPEALLILVLAPEFYLPLRMLGLRFHAGMAGTTAGRRIFEILDTPVPTPPAITARDGLKYLAHFSDLSVRDISFTYPGRQTPALDGINLDIALGDNIAIVGGSGAGKSTLFGLLLRFMEPQSGMIFLNRVPLISLPIDSWRDMVAWVPQRPHLLNDSIAANIRLGKPEASQVELVEAARLANLDVFIESLPLKYDTPIGESGARLSTGQAQRLALARAFIKDAPLILLDEPTSMLDPETETLLEQATRRLLNGRTVITIAHRLNTVFRADQIIVLESGRIVESGTHQELIGASGKYSRMIEALAGGMKAVPSKSAVTALLPADNPVIASDFSVSRIEPPVSRGKSEFRRLLGFLTGSWGWVTLAVLLSTLTIASSVALMGTSAWMISTAAMHPSIADLGVSIVGVRLFGISRGVFRYLERLVSHNVTFRLLAQLRVWFYEKLEPLAPARLMEYRSGDLLARIVGDVEILENFYVRVVSPPLTAVLIAVGTGFFLWFFNPFLIPILVSLFFVQGILLPILGGIMSRRTGAQLIHLRAELNARLLDGLQGMADLLAFNRSRSVQAQISGISQLYGKAQRQIANISAIQSGLAVFLTNFGLWTVLYISIPAVRAGSLDGVMLASLALLTIASFEAVTPLPLAAQMLNITRAAARRLFSVVDTTSQVVDIPSLSGFPDEIRVFSSPPAVEFIHVDLKYSDGDVPALQDISFEIEPGKSVAIVGPSGAGKSSLANILLRFWDFSSGDILIAGRSIRDYAQDDLRAQIAIVSQDAHFFNASVYENLRLARRGVTAIEIEEAAKKALIHETIMKMPHGYDTMVGEHGLHLSAGERQRLSIARALIKRAPILLFDEPTANLDAETERQILEALSPAILGRTTLFITHRLVGLNNMDQILVMNHGKIVEKGDHNSLLQQAGLYRRLWDLQNRLFVENAAPAD